MEFIEHVELILQRFKYIISVIEHLDEASTSISLNIAEGTGKFTSKDKCKFFDISRGSALECASCLDILIRKKKISEEEYNKGKQILYEIVAMLIGLLKSNSDRVYENNLDYNLASESI